MQYGVSCHLHAARYVPVIYFITGIGPFDSPHRLTPAITSLVSVSVSLFVCVLV